MSFISDAKVQLQAARCVGRKDYDEAIRVLEAALSGSPRDVPFLELIAHCHYWANREDLALTSAQKALELDPKSFGAIKFMSGIYAKRTEHEVAAQYVRRGLENYPKPLPTPPKAFFLFLRLASFLFPRLRAIEKRAREDIADPNKSNSDWYTWARQYLAWYDGTHSDRTSPTVH